MFNRFFKTLFLAIYMALAIGGHAAHRFQHVSGNASCCPSESLSSCSSTLGETGCLPLGNAASTCCPANSQPNDGENDSSECLTCCVLSQIADTSATENVPLGVACTFLKTTEYSGLYVESSRRGFMVRGPPAFLFLQS